VKSDYSLQPIDALSPAAVAGVRGIYEDGFPAYQRADFAELTEQPEAGEFSLALVRGSQPCGFAMLRALGDTGWVYLRYLVVDRGQRGQGLGGTAWDLLTARLRAAGFTLLVWDVDDPAEPGHGPAEAGIRSRRISFYERQGGRLLPVTGYRAPHVAPGPGDPGWEPMLLMAAPLAADAAGLRVRAVVDAVYRYRWHADPGDPQLADVRINSE